MSTDHDDRDREVPLPEFADPDGAAARRADGVRRSRRISNWTAATLLVGAGAAAVGLAHQAVSGSSATNSPQVGHSVTTSGGSQVAHSTTQSGSHATKAPKVSKPVTTTSGSGVTTTTRTVNGKTVVIKTHHSGDD